VLTVDAPLLGRRERDVKNRFALPPDLGIENLHAAGYARLPPASGESGLAAYVAELLDPSLTWDAIAWLRSITALPLLVKGILRPDDAVRAVERGAAGVEVSNHGGRQLVASPATIEVLTRGTSGNCPGRSRCSCSKSERTTSHARFATSPSETVA
jgi:4-hydroxymandelate oxidase